MNQHRSVRHALAVIVLAAILLESPVFAGTISMSWDPVTHPDLTGYRIYVDDGSGAFGQSVDVGAVTEATLAGLADCTMYTVGVKAYDSAGDESSALSNLISGWARPELTSISPAQVEHNSEVELIVAGANFQAGATVTFGDPAIGVNSVSQTNCHQLVVSVSVGAGAVPGPVAAEVVNPDHVFGSANGLFAVTLDATLPEIEGVLATEVGATTTHVVWATDEPASGAVWFRRQGEATYHQNTQDALVTVHDILLQGLDPETTYEFHVRSADAAGNEAISSNQEFTTFVSSHSYLRFEAEAGVLAGPVGGLAENGTFRGGSIELPAGSSAGSSANPSGSAAFGFYLPSGGSWQVWTRVHSSDAQGRSWFEGVDGAALAPLASVATTEWSWVGGRVYQLQAGLHSLVLGGYRADSRADRILITDDPEFVPTEEPGDDVVAPPAVVNAGVEGGESLAVLSWTAPPSADAVELVIRYRTDGIFPVSPADGLPLTVQVLTSGVGGSYEHAGLANDTTYRYALFTVDAAGNASVPVGLESTPAASLPAPVTNLERTDSK